MIKNIYSCVHGVKDLKRYATECADENCDLIKKLNKTQFCGCSPYTGGEPRYIWCCGSCVVLLCSLCIDKYIYLISKIVVNK